MSTEVEVLGQRYRVERLPPMTQFHVLRRMGAPLAQCLAAHLDEKATAQQLLLPVMEAVGRLSDADTEYVMGHCLAVVSRYDSRTETWAPAFAAGTARPMFQDIALPAMLALVREVMKVQFSNFFAAVDPPESSVAAQETGRASPTARTS